ncbi:precorrin-8X methylmutase [Desulfurispora thermophila]|uniref:precorrin-8X methylmutase n=1 Tax=Desulfurispora thermophila TaxID=265470 RepID=UPI000365CD5C|nr:precorrin-8X methylmutase [Desulfurispora thermophila]
MEFLLDPVEIAKKSMTIIEENLPQLAQWPPLEREVLKRIIHTSGDLSCLSLIDIHPDAVKTGIKAISAGQDILTDVNMVRAGLISSRLGEFGISVHCLINDPLVVAEAREKGLTRAMVAIQRGASLAEGGIVAIGNAPTALFALCDLIQKGQARPALVVGMPVGFVGAKESKELLVSTGVPYITIHGTRGGSNMAAAAVNALLLLA